MPKHKLFVFRSTQKQYRVWDYKRKSHRQDDNYLTVRDFVSTKKLILFFEIF